MTETPRRHETKVVGTRQLSSASYELTIARDGLTFEAGRLITIHGRDPTEDRSYTICSGIDDEHIQVLYRHIPTGKLTPQLVTLKAGDPLAMSGPYGEFVVRDTARPIIFIATGTGVAPCRAYLRSHAGLDLTLIHGVRLQEDLYYAEEFSGIRYFPCVTQESGLGHEGRVTEFFAGFDVDPACHFYLCGANEMIFDMHALLKDRGIDDSQIFTEAYYYRLHT